MWRKWFGSILISLCFNLVFITITNADDNPDNIKSSKCKTLFTYGYGYRQFFHLSSHNTPSNGDMLNLKIMVKARSDAHILLSPSPSPEEVDPVYEIVLGAGKNSFSDIRRKRRSATKASAYTKDILSGVEERGFWIRINNLGVVMVGNEGNDLPFMEWQDPDPLFIEYFSFCTWSGVAGKWLYDCAENKEAVAVQPVLSSIQKLRQALLTNYDIYSTPVFNNSQPIEINVQMQANYVNLDLERSAMTVGCEFTLDWYDEKIVWNPDDYQGINKLNLIHHEIWQPEIIHFNSLGKDVLPLNQGKTGLKVLFDGKVSWRSRNHIETKCQLDLRDWPWDTQTCSIKLGLLNRAEIVQLILLENGTKMEMQSTNSEWTLLQIGAESDNARKPFLIDLDNISEDNLSDTNANALTFTFTLERSNTGITYIFVIPLVVIVTLSLTCFWMDPLGKEKLAINCMLIILLCAFLLRLGSVLSTTSESTPYLLKLYCCVLMIETCATVLTVVIIQLVSNTHLSPPPRFICNALTSPTIITLLCLPKPQLKSQDYGQLSETGEMVDFVQPAVDSDSVANIFWRLVASFCDRVAFILALIAYMNLFM